MKSPTPALLAPVQAVSSTRRRMLLAAGLPVAAALMARTGAVQAQRSFQEGTDYRLVQPPQPTDGQGKIEVIEFFWYACPHCYDFQPAMERWRKTMPADVYLRRVPVAFSPDREPHSRTYYALDSLGLIDSLHAKFFQALGGEHQKLFTAETIADFMAQHGVDRKKWLDTYNSFGVAARTQSARRIVDNYKVDGTPALAVAGKFYTSPSMARGGDAALQVVDFLVAQVRKGAR